LTSDKVVGALILAGSILGIIIYTGLLFFFSLILLEVTAFVGVAVLLGILAWIGWTMATTPPPEPISDLPSGTAGPAMGQTPSGTTQQIEHAETKK
jgi:predicted DNA-binding transcriptional regulator